MVGTGGDASGSYNVSTCAALDRRRRGRAGRQARQPRAVVEIRRGRRARRARRQDRAAPGRDHPLHLRGRHRLHVRARAPSGDEERRRRRASSSAPARSSICSARCPIRPSVKRQMIGVFSRQWIEPMAQVLEDSRLRMRLGGAWLRRSRRDHHVRPDPHRGAGERRGPHLRDQSGGHRALRASKPEALRGGDAAGQCRGADGRAQGQQGPVSRHRDLQRGGGADRRRPRQGLEGRRGDRGEVDRFRRGRGPARPAGQGLERGNDRYPAKRSRPTSARRSRRPSARAPTPMSRPRRRQRPPRADFSTPSSGKHRRRRLCADRRDQEGEPVGGADPRRLRSAGARARL